MKCQRLGHPIAFKIWVFGFFLLIFLVEPVKSQNYAIDWFTIDGGGGSSSGGNFSLSGTIGQPDANSQQMAGGRFLLTGGFWSLVAIQSPNAPTLTIQLTGTNTALIMWPSPSPGFSLQQNGDLKSASWSAPVETVNDNGVNKFIIVNPPAGNRFYRLNKGS